MQILIKEENGFMPATLINIKEDVVEIEENRKTRTLKYSNQEIKEIMSYLLDLFKPWKDKYIQNKIIDDEIYTISIISKVNKEIYIKNKYPANWDKFIVFRNKLVREEL